MPESLLTTKLYIPASPHSAMARPRLTRVLEQGVTLHRLSLVTAPAGYGKTTLLADWARATATAVAWLSLDETDGDFDRFLRYLLAAWERIQPSVVDGPLGLLIGSLQPDRQTVLTAFLNTASQLPAHQVFVLDDYHLIQEAAVHEGLSFLLDHLPAQLHFVIGTRATPEELPVARYRARGQLLELSPADLSFTLEEATHFLNRATGTPLPAHEIRYLQEQLEGWAAGLQLAALSLRQRGPEGLATATISGQERFIADYLSRDVLDNLPPEVGAFLLQTSLLERLCGPLCEAVTGLPDGQRMLERIERQNLFVQALDRERTWFRYHRLFADFLRGELESRHPDQVIGVHRRAAGWYLSQKLPEGAFHHAIAGHDVERVIEIFDKFFNAKLNGGEIKIAARWVHSLPAEWYATYPVFGLMRVGLLYFTGEYEACFRLLGEIEQQLVAQEGEDTRPQLAKVMAVRCYMACAQNDLVRAEAYADRALRDLPPGDVGFRPGVYGALGDAYRRQGRWEDARQCYRKALEITDAPAGRLFSVHVYGALADLELNQGRLQNASRYWRKALEAIRAPENWGRLALPVTGWIYIRMGELLYEWDQLPAAWDHLSRGLKHAELGRDVRAMIAGYVCAGRLKVTEGDLDGAGDYLERARVVVETAQFPEWQARFQRLQLEYWLAQDRLRAAVNWADAMLQGSAFEGQPETEAAELATARVLIVKGDTASLEQARTLLERLRGTADEEGRTGVSIEALALLALAQQVRGARAEALVLLERALRLAESHGYVRLFADLGLPMGRLLQEARSRTVQPDYVDKLLGAIRVDAAASPPDDAGLPEPLTEREMEVLQLLAAGLTNREIAEQLVVSPETVKKHGANIYAKLGARNRTAAVARARTLGLLG